MSEIIQFSPVRVLDANADPIAGAKAYFYATGTSTPVVVYADEARTVAHPVPLVADAQGVFAAVFASETLKVNVTDSADATVNGYPIDPALHSSSSDTGASGVPFRPVDGNSATDVQQAIENNLAAIDGTLSETRTISAGAGLLGGGDLSADRLFYVDIADSGDMTAGTANKMVDAAEHKASVAAATAAIGFVITTVTRIASTSYQNTTGAGFMISLMTSGGGANFVQISEDGVAWSDLSYATGGGLFHNNTFGVPDTWYWRINGAATVDYCQQISVGL